MSEMQKITRDAREAMTKAVENFRREISTVRTGKATTSLLDTVRVEAWGQMTPLNQLASVSAPEARLLVVQPWDRTQIAAIEKGIKAADLGLNPANDGTIIRIPIPPLNEERRRELVKLVKKFAEEGKIAVRHARTDAITRAKKVEHVSDDEKRHEEKEIQKLHDDFIGQIDAMVKAREADIMEV